MNSYLKRATELKETMLQDRRYIHQNAERGMVLPVTSAYVRSRLEQMGYEVTGLGESGLTVIAGDPNSERVILLRADMDALPMREDSGLEFASKTDSAHCCGHDLHTTMLLAAAQMIKEREGELKGAVKFLFQPGEEVGRGAAAMVEAGVLENPKPTAVLAMHVNAKSPLLQLNYGKGCTFCSDDTMNIRIIGRGGHGARPHETVDPIKVACHVYMALQSIKANTISPLEPVILTITGIHGGGEGHNIIPDEVELKGTVRAYNSAARADLLEQIETKAKMVAAAFGAEAEVVFNGTCAPLVCSAGFTDEILDCAAEVLGRERIAATSEVKMGAEDFSAITEHYPDTSAYLFIGAGPDEQTPYPYGQHNTKVVFNEDVMPYGAAVMAASAALWLEKKAQ